MPQDDLQPASWEDVVSAAARANGVSPQLALAVAKRESSLNPDATGDGGQAVGMFQLHPGAAVDTGTTDRSDPLQNITGGVKYLKKLSDRYKGDISKALMAYNGGPDGVDAGTPSAAAQAYATEIMGSLSGGAPAPTGAAPMQSPADAERGQHMPPTPMDEFKARRAKNRADLKAHEPVRDAAYGAVRGAVSTVQTLASPIRKVFGMPPATPPPEETTTAGKVGRTAEQLAEFVVPATEISKGAKAVNLAEKLTANGAPLLASRVAAGAAEGVAQGATAYGVSKSQGASEGTSRVNAALSAIAPVATKAIELAAPAIRSTALTKLARVFAKGVENAGPEIQYGLKTGDLAPDVADAARIVRQAASDMLDLPLQASWGKWMTTTGKGVSAKGKALGDALDGELGSEMLFKQPIYDALDDLVTKSARHLAEIAAGTSSHGITETAEKVYNKPLFDAVEKLKAELDGYGPMISVRNLSDVKQVWDKAVYGLSTAGKVAVSPEVLTATAQKEATKRGADAIRTVFDQKAPTIDDLNQAMSHAYRLQDLVRKLYKVSPGLGPGASTVLHVIGAGAGATVGSELGGHTLYGIMAGGALARAVQTAFESPLWQTMTPMLKGKLASALANGNADAVRTIIAPLLAGANTKRSTTDAAVPQPAARR